MCFNDLVLISTSPLTNIRSARSTSLFAVAVAVAVADSFLFPSSCADSMNERCRCTRHKFSVRPISVCTLIRNIRFILLRALPDAVKDWNISQTSLYVFRFCFVLAVCVCEMSRGVINLFLSARSSSLSRLQCVNYFTPAECISKCRCEDVIDSNAGSGGDEAIEQFINDECSVTVKRETSIRR